MFAFVLEGASVHCLCNVSFSSSTVTLSRTQPHIEGVIGCLAVVSPLNMHVAPFLIYEPAHTPELQYIPQCFCTAHWELAMTALKE